MAKERLFAAILGIVFLAGIHVSAEGDEQVMSARVEVIIDYKCQLPLFNKIDRVGARAWC